jgi:2-dehydropantoate 2-reductase
MHVVVLGAGALGTLFGVMAWLGGGTRVTLVGRGEHIRAVVDGGAVVMDRERGSLKAVGPGFTAVTDLAAIEGDIDYLLVCVKQSDTGAALAAARAVGSRVGCVLSLQNGLEQDDDLARAFGADKVIGATTMEGAALVRPGVIEHLLSSTTYLGEVSGVPSERVERLAGVLRLGGLPTEAVADVKTAQWTKFVQSCAASGICGVTGLGYAPATATEAGAQLYLGLVREGVAVMRAHGLEPGPFFGDALRIREISRGSEHDAVALIRGVAADLLARGYTGTTSLARDLAAGRPTELDALLGAMIRAAGRGGVAVPTMRAIHLAIGTMEASGRARTVPRS